MLQMFDQTNKTLSNHVFSVLVGEYLMSLNVEWIGNSFLQTGASLIIGSIPKNPQIQQTS